MQISRLFILDYCTLSSSIARLGMRDILPGDYFVVIINEMIALPDSINERLSKLSDMDVLLTLDCEDLSEEDRGRFVVAKLRPDITENTVIFFVDCVEYKATLGVGFAPYCKKVICINAVREAKAYFDDDMQPDPTDDKSSNFSSAGSDDVLFSAAQKIKNARSRRPNVDNDTRGSDDYTGNASDSDDTSKSDKRNRQQSQSVNDTDFSDILNNMQKNGQNPTKGQPGSSRRTTPRKPNPQGANNPSNTDGKSDDSNTDNPDKKNTSMWTNLRQIEKEIFNDIKIDDVMDEDYTEMDKEKASLLLSVFERLKEHLNEFISNAENLGDDDYNEVIVQLIKSNTFKDFKTCVELINISAKIHIPQELYFWALKNEANYYKKMCDLFYREDKWI